MSQGQQGAHSYSLGLAWFFLRTRPVRTGAVLVASVVAAVMALIVVTQSLQTSGEQLAAYGLGDADYSLRLDTAEVPLGTVGSETNAQIVEAMTSAGATDAEVGYAIFGLTPDSHPDVSVNMYEREWTENPYPDRFTLEEGALPIGPGEVVVSRALSSAFPVGSTFSLFDGALSASVVGVVVDNFYRSASFVLSPPGTWDSLQGVSAAEAERFAASAAREIYWAGEADPAEVLAAVVPVVVADADEQQETLDSWLQTTESKESVENYSPPLFAELAFLMLLGPVAASLFSSWFAVRALNRMRSTMLLVGVYRTRLAGTSAILLSVAASAAAGAAIGVLLGLAIRPVLDATGNSELGPIRDVLQLSAGALLAAILGAGLSLLLLRNPAPLAEKQVRLRRLRSITDRLPSPGQLIPAAIIVLIVAGSVLAQGGTTNEQFAALYVFGLAAVLLSPLALLLVTKLKVAGLAHTLALRRIAADFRLAALALTALSALLMVSFAISTIYLSATTAQNARRESDTPPSQIHFQPSLEKPEETESVRDEIEAYVGLDSPVLFYRAIGSSGLRTGATLIFDSVEDLEQVADVQISSDQEDLLDSGGTLRTKNPEIDQIIFTTPDGQSIPMSALMLAGLDPSFEAYDGFILTATAQRYGIESAAPTWAYTDVDKEQISKAMRAAGTLGFQKDWLQVYEEPAVATEPAEFTLIAAVVAILAGAIMAFYASASSRALRPSLAAVRALGIRKGWLVAALVAQVGTVLVISVIFAALGAAFATQISLSIWLPGVPLEIPWRSISILVLVLGGVVALALAISSRKLSSEERSSLL